MTNSSTPNPSKNAQIFVPEEDLPANEEDLFKLSSFLILDTSEAIKFTLTEDMLAETLTLMLDSLSDEVTKMKQFHAQGDWEKTQAMAHKIKGGCVYVGTIRMKMACQYFERYWKAGHTDLLEKLYQQVLDTIEESIILIEKWRNNKQNS
ncbi:Hpt domain-containing protein [Legionella fallonii]|uniref:HPt domain-containing protein n=1 Tax=Legionella fallonii LLAP-10 TaxID=1212491 RepID=A0A098G8T3_9GAMM|nr:Hpt domain-containing protein [Legionella fallonii]CEG58376.1 conserved protein of unknown function [Legionella fallonii LLAP-10]